mmetsp:Transcript_37538/g.108155  ORF Transcript_37538/g.108155 Transcript_37538/m.108155 type:complete len:249 (+) Transcript_37538:1402-2148(+)
MDPHCRRGHCLVPRGCGLPRLLWLHPVILVLLRGHLRRGDARLGLEHASQPVPDCLHGLPHDAALPSEESVGALLQLLLRAHCSDLHRLPDGGPRHGRHLQPRRPLPWGPALLLGAERAQQPPLGIRRAVLGSPQHLGRGLPLALQRLQVLPRAGEPHPHQAGQVHGDRHGHLLPALRRHCSGRVPNFRHERGRGHPEELLREGHVGEHRALGRRPLPHRQLPPDVQRPARGNHHPLEDGDATTGSGV